MIKITKKFKFWFLLIFGIFLLLDGSLSIWFGNECLNQCANNNNFGNLVRVIRGIGGAVLLVLAFTKR